MMKSMSSSMIESMKDDIDVIMSHQGYISESLAVFRGHFPGNPVLPGIYSIELAIRHVALRLQRRISLHSVKRCKFIKPISPGMRIQINVTLVKQDDNLQKVKVLLVEKEQAYPLTKLTMIVKI